jgi:hypothetical protein
MSDDWSTVCCPIYKKGEKTDCKKYRRISLLSTSHKILAKIVANRLTPYIENIVRDYQCGFQKGRSKMDQIFSLRTILEKCCEFSVDLYILFIDFKQSCNGMYRNKLYKITYEFGISGKLITLVSISITNTKGKVAIQGEVSENFKIERGLKQGDVLSTIIFNFILGKVLRNITINPNGTIFNRMIQYLAYADDNIIISRTEMYLQSAVSQLYAEVKENGLIINENKTKYMIISRNKERWMNKQNRMINVVSYK